VSTFNVNNLEKCELSWSSECLPGHPHELTFIII